VTLFIGFLYFYAAVSVATALWLTALPHAVIAIEDDDVYAVIAISVFWLPIALTLSLLFLVLYVHALLKD
jgi:hypothetical protein